MSLNSESNITQLNVDMECFRTFLTVSLFLLCSMVSWADHIVVDGIAYAVTDSTNLTCEVRKGPMPYSGKIIIPATVHFDGKNWQVKSIGQFAFSDCPNLSSVKIPNSVTSIGDFAFFQCGLTSVEMGNSVTSIGEYAFIGCSSLANIVIPSSVTKIGMAAFAGCDSLDHIFVAVGNPVYDSRDNCHAIIETASNTLVAGCKKTKIPSSVTCIGEMAFNGCNLLVNINIPSSVTTIGKAAFIGCDSLASVMLSSDSLTIGHSAFKWCSSLESLEIVGRKVQVGKYAFSDCTSLSTVKISVPSLEVGEGAFSGTNFNIGVGNLNIGNITITNRGTGKINIGTHR